MDNDNLTNENITPSENTESSAEEIKKNENTETPAEETKAEVKAEETPAETPAAETVSETKTEEPKPETPKEEPKADVQAEEPATEVKAEEKKAEETVSETKTEEPKADAKTEEAKKETVNRFTKYAPVYEELAAKKDTKEKIEVEVKDRIRGGLRVIYKNVPLFLPASHFSLRRNPSEKELSDSVSQKFLVEIHEIQEYDEGRKAVIVSRKNQLVDEFWNNIHVDDIVEGRVSSIASFGVFLDLGGVEGLIHISRLSHIHVDDPSKFVKKGDTLKAKVVELDREKNRIALNHKELEESPWSKIDEEFPVDTVQKGIVRRLTDFGAYIELKPGVDGLLRTPEISWTKRVKRPADILKPNQEIDVKILAVSTEKKTIALSYKQTTENPWPAMHEKYPIGSEFEGTVFQVIPQGMIVTINDELDGFMPRSKMKRVLQGNKIPFQVGDKLTVSIVDLVPDDESLILAPKVDEEELRARHQKKAARTDSSPKIKDGGISLGDMINDEAKKGLIDSL